MAAPSDRRSLHYERRPKDAYALPARRGEVNKLTRSRDAPSHPSFALTLQESPSQLLPPIKKGGGAPISASTGVRPAAERKACQRMRRAPSSCPATRGTKTAARSPLGAPPRSCAEGLTLRLGSGRASWNHRIQTGVPSPAPVQRAPRSPVTRRTGRCPSRPKTRCMAAFPGTALVPLSKVPSRKVPP
jgi:hypothetical protein